MSTTPVRIPAGGTDRRLLLLGETQNPLTGYVGCGALVACAIVIMSLQLSSSPVARQILPWKSALAALVACVAMITVEIVWFKTHLRNFDFASPRPLDQSAWDRIRQRLLGLVPCLWLAGAICALWSTILPIYIVCFALFLPVALVLSVPYFCLVERYGRTDGPADEMLVFGQGLSRVASRQFDRSPRPKALALVSNTHTHNLLRGIFVRSFFTPYIMLCCLTWWQCWASDSQTAFWASCTWLQAPHTTMSVFHCWDKALIALIFATDSTCAFLGYAMPCRLLDTQFKSVDPTPTGWFWTLVCYRPLNALLDGYIFSQIVALPMTWSDSLLQSHPFLGIVVSLALLIFSAAFAWTTATYGLRLSNMSNRGIICSGPYSVIRHPHYLCKNAIWALSLVPLASEAPGAIVGPALAICGAVCVYAMRALTEEHHLFTDPHYREYCRRVKWRFVPGIF